MTQPIQAKDVAAERVEFLWGGRIPKSMITVVAGRPDQGKGLFAARVAADVSVEGTTVLYSAAEDSHGLMTRPRLEAAGADLDRVLLWRFQLPAQMQELYEHVVANDVKLIVMDPFASHLGQGISKHSDNARTVLSPLEQLCTMTGCSILIIDHALKRIPANGHPLNAIGGVALPQFARAAYVFGTDPENEDSRVLCPVKFNIGPTPKPLTFEVDVEDIAEVGDMPSLVVGNEVVFDAMRLFQQPKSDKPAHRPADKRTEACEWLTRFLAEAGATPSGQVMNEAKKLGMAVKTLRRAADDMEIVKCPPGGGRNCTWDLPDEIKDMLGLSTEPADGVVEGPCWQDGTFYLEQRGQGDEPEIGDVDDFLTGLLGGGNDE